MKKIILFITSICLVMSMGVLTGCTSSNANASSNTNSNTALPIEDKYSSYIKDFAQAIENNDWIKAKRMESFSHPDSKEITTLSQYSQAIEYIINSGSNIYEIENAKSKLKEIDKNYNGVLSSKIMSLVNSLDSTPKIGYSKYQVYVSSWGLPKSINRTTTATNTSEQWVYGNRKYIYLDNDIVTAIQD